MLEEKDVSSVDPARCFLSSEDGFSAGLSGVLRHANVEKLLCHGVEVVSGLAGVGGGGGGGGFLSSRAGGFVGNATLPCVSLVSGAASLCRCFFSPKSDRLAARDRRVSFTLVVLKVTLTRRPGDVLKGGTSRNNKLLSLERINLLQERISL